MCLAYVKNSQSRRLKTFNSRWNIAAYRLLLKPLVQCLNICWGFFYDVQKYYDIYFEIMYYTYYDIDGCLFKSLDPHYCRTTCGTSLVTHRWAHSDYSPLVRETNRSMVNCGLPTMGVVLRYSVIWQIYYRFIS